MSEFSPLWFVIGFMAIIILLPMYNRWQERRDWKKADEQARKELGLDEEFGHDE